MIPCTKKLYTFCICHHMEQPHFAAGKFNFKVPFLSCHCRCNGSCCHGEDPGQARQFETYCRLQDPFREEGQLSAILHPLPEVGAPVQFLAASCQVAFVLCVFLPHVF